MKTGKIINQLVIALIIINCSCDSYNNCIKGDGNYKVEKRIITESFHGIEMDGSFNVIVRKDTVINVEVEADSNLLPFIITRVRSGRLLIDNDQQCFRTKRTIYVYITVPQMDQVMLDGSGNIEIDSMDAQNIEVELNGSGNIYIDDLAAENADIVLDGSGNMELNIVTTMEFDLRHEGSGRIEIMDILSNYIDINLDGSGIVEMYKIDAHDLGAQIGGSGSIELEGDVDRTDLKISSSGSIKAFNLYQDECDAYISGSGAIYVFVYDYLTVEITGSGMLYYQGNPRVYLIDNTNEYQVVRK